MFIDSSPRHNDAINCKKKPFETWDPWITSSVDLRCTIPFAKGSMRTLSVPG